MSWLAFLWQGSIALRRESATCGMGDLMQQDVAVTVYDVDAMFPSPPQKKRKMGVRSNASISTVINLVSDDEDDHAKNTPRRNQQSNALMGVQGYDRPRYA